MAKFEVLYCFVLEKFLTCLLLAEVRHRYYFYFISWWKKLWVKLSAQALFFDSELAGLSYQRLVFFCIVV